MSAFDVAKKYLKAEPEQPAPDPVWTDPSIASSRIEDGEIIAVEICSRLLETHVWLAFDDSFNPNDAKAVFYAHELPFLKDKTPEQLREIHKVKVAFGPGSRVRQ
jgi:hypothetical protein